MLKILTFLNIRVTLLITFVITEVENVYQETGTQNPDSRTVGKMDKNTINR